MSESGPLRALAPPPGGAGNRPSIAGARPSEVLHFADQRPQGPKDLEAREFLPCTVLDLSGLYFCNLETAPPSPSAFNAAE